MFGFSGEHLLLFVAILFVFGPRRLPEAGRALGKAVRNAKEQWRGIIEPSYKKLGEREEKPNV